MIFISIISSALKNLQLLGKSSFSNPQHKNVRRGYLVLSEANTPQLWHLCVFIDIDVFLPAYLQIDMYGPTLMTIRSYTTGKYICHNPQTGYVEVKVRSFSSSGVHEVLTGLKL